jgi:uncharacterized protein (TIGR02117 family)
LALGSPRVPGGVLVALAVIAISGCAGPAVSLPPLLEHDVGGPWKDVWVVSHGWHTRVALRRADVDPAIWPESRDFGGPAYLEVGWGDRDFYSKPAPSLWDAIDPVIRATPAALHVGAFDARPEEFFAGQPVVRLSVPAVGIDRLARFIADHYARDSAGHAVRIRPGYYPRSAFYLATGRYHAFTYNSNSWTASALRGAGVPIEGTVVTSGAVMRKAVAIADRQKPRPSSVISGHDPAFAEAQEDLAGPAGTEVDRRAGRSVVAVDARALIGQVIIAAQIPELAQRHRIRQITREQDGSKLGVRMIDTEPDVRGARRPGVSLRGRRDDQVVYELSARRSRAPRDLSGPRCLLDDP